MSFPTVTAAGNFIVNPGSVATGLLETPLRGPAWWALGLSQAWGFPETTGTNIKIPGVAGKSAYPLIADELSFTLELRVLGECNRAGTPNTDLLTGLLTNLDDLWTNVGNPPTTATRDAHLVKPDASTTSNVGAQFRMAIASMKASVATVLLDVTIPSGRML